MRFAHISDVHLGYQKNTALQGIERDVFHAVLDECISHRVDFILIPGDLFHVNIPEMRVQKFAFSGFRKVHDAGIPVYVVYGSHDFSPVSNSVIDLLVETGYITKVSQNAEDVDGMIRLGFTLDEKTGAKLVGLPGLKTGKDIEYYQKLDRESLEAESGFKIFLFHGGIAEMKGGGDKGEYMPLSLLPRGFDYYAGGHLHKHAHIRRDDYSHVVYPGTPFAGYHSDLEDAARGEKHGFVLAESSDDGGLSVEFVPIEMVDHTLVQVDAHNKKPASVTREITEKTQAIEPTEKIIILRVEGVLSEGKTTEIDFTGIRRRLLDGGALDVLINHNKLTSSEYDVMDVRGSTRDEIVKNIFTENTKRSRQKDLSGEAGAALAEDLLKCLMRPQNENERKYEYEKRLQEEALKILDLSIDDT